MKKLLIENKKLLFKDLSQRFPYKVMVYIRYSTGEPCYGELTPLDLKWFTDSKIKEINPYLRPMSSMTNEERHELQEILGRDCEISEGAINIIESSRKSFSFPELQALFDWLNKNMFDYRGMIPLGLALEAPEGMYNN